MEFWTGFIVGGIVFFIVGAIVGYVSHEKQLNKLGFAIQRNGDKTQVKRIEYRDVVTDRTKWND